MTVYQHAKCLQFSGNEWHLHLSSCPDRPTMLISPWTRHFNQSSKFRIDLVAFAALKVSFKHRNPSQSEVDLTVWRPTPSQLWSSATEVGNWARGSRSLTSLGLTPLSSPIQSASRILGETSPLSSSVDCVSASSSTPSLSSTELTVRRRQTDEYTSGVSLPSSRAR